MKRIADKQLSKDDGEEDDVQEVSGEGFKKADERTLAGRKIRALPKRSLASMSSTTSSMTSNTSDTEAKPRFSGFAGFGAPAAPPSGSFSFTAPNSAATTTPSLFGSVPAQNVSSSASSATKTFASYLNKPPQAEALAPTPQAPIAATNEPDPVEVKYYLALRGLNESFLSAAKQAVEKDPFADLSVLLDQYKRHRISEESKRSEKPKSSSTASFATNPAPLAVSEPPKPPAAMPTPPSSFSGFGGPGSSAPSGSSRASTPSSGGFTPKLDTSSEAPKSGFSFPSTNGSGGVSLGQTSGPKPDAPKTSEFSFTKPAASQSTEETKAPLSSGFSFAKPASLSTKEESKPPAASGFTFGSSSFGTKDAKESAETDKKASISNPFALSASATDKATPSFGTSTPSAFGTGSSAFGSGFKSAATFGSSGTSSFATSSGTATPFGTSSTSGGFGFISKPGSSGSLGNPVGFGFGSPPKTDSGDKPAFSSTGFSFAKPPALTEGASSGFALSKPTEPATASSEGTSEEVNGNAEGGDAPALSGPNAHDQEGEGEEDEETSYEIKAKAYKLKTDKEGQTLWAELGVGMFRLKKHKNTGSRRMLMRNSNTGKIILNANLYSGLNPTVTKKALKFVAHDEESNAQTYTLRVATEDQAGDLKAAFEREIAFVKAKNEG